MAQDGTEGSIVTMVRELTPARAVLVYVPDQPKLGGDKSAMFDTREYLQELGLTGDIVVTQFDCEPTDIPGLLRQTLQLVRTHVFPERTVLVNTTSGTPHMKLTWAVLLNSGLLDGTAYEVVAPKFAADKNRVTPVDFSFLKEASLLERINDAIVHHRYMHAKQLLDQLAHSTCDPTRETMARRAANVVELVDKWDKMRYNDARCNAPAIIKDLQRYPNCMDVQMLVERWEANLRLLCRDSAEGGFQRLCDILSNARRRFDEGNYVDAVGRVRRLYEGVLYLALAAHGVNPQNPRQSTTAEHGVLNYTRPLSVVEAKDFCCLFNPRVQVFLTSRSAELDNCRIDDVAEEIVKLRNSSVVGHGQEQVTQAKAATSLKLGAVLLKGFAEMYRDRWQLTDQNNAFPAGKSRHPLCVPAQHLIAKKDSPSSRRTPHTAPMCAKYKEVALCLLG